jgi:dipeptidase D
MSLQSISPQEVWNHFFALNAVPRASKKEQQVIEFIKSFGKGLNLEVVSDNIGNVLIKKEATPGMEAKKGIILQAHLDMVHQKNNETDFDFDSQGIDMYVDDDWVKAKGTTLGADNGLGVAMIMAILSSKDLAHPSLEALFTIDEETGMTGALGLSPGFLSHDILINLDTEDDNEITIGCAGGIDVSGTKKYTTIAPPFGYKGFRIEVKGLNGGHSGMDIHKELGNANKIMNRLLYNLCNDGRAMLCTLDGGSLRNAIPRESVATICMHPDLVDDFKAEFEILAQIIKNELKRKEAHLNLTYTEIPSPYSAMDPIHEVELLNTIYAIHNGAYRFSSEVEGLVETSNNVARVEVKDGVAQILCLSRSSIESGKEEMVNQLSASFKLGGFTVSFGGNYPGWSPNASSNILSIVKQIYAKNNGIEPHVSACHAGLECGIIGQHYTDLDMISIGPNILGAHSPDEKASISSLVKFWSNLKEILKNIPNK